MIYVFSRFICVLILKLFFSLKVKGRECIPKKGSFILASNHISNLDPVAVGVACQRILYYLGKKELFKGRFVSWFMKKLNVIPLKRGKADTFAVRTAIKVLKGKGLALLSTSSGVLTNSQAKEQGLGGEVLFYIW